jgi:hypothetical protein
MNRDETIAVETSVGADRTLEKTTSPERDVADDECDADVAGCDGVKIDTDDFWLVWTADFERAIDSPSSFNFMH